MTTYYSNELKKLDYYFKALPKLIPVNNAYLFLNYELNQTEIEDYGLLQSRVNKYLKLGFNDQNHGLVQFKEHDSALEAVVPVLRTFITKDWRRTCC